MKKALFVVPLLFAALGAAPVVNADLTYSVNQGVDTGSISGILTTDGAIGTLGESDIVDWNVTLNDGTAAIDLLPSNSFVGIFGSDLTASASSLMFNFSGLDDGYFFISDPNPGAEQGAFCYESSDFCSGFPAGIVIFNLGGDNLFPFAAESGQQTIATVVATPEPGTAALLLTGLASTILIRKRVAGLVRPDPARR